MFAAYVRNGFGVFGFTKRCDGYYWFGAMGPSLYIFTFHMMA